MGDVAQNVNFNTGMNDWEELRKEVFYSKKDKFYVLAKSYRNTIEISNFAEAILKKCSFKNYKIETVIRHGEEVKKIKVDSEDKLMETLVMHICEIQEEGYPTIAIICLNEEQADMVREGLKKKVKFLHNEKNINEFGKNVMVLPILLTKGLEFDAVLLWNPDKESYPLNNKNGKLLYVAATRALHKLRIIYSGDLSELL